MHFLSRQKALKNLLVWLLEPGPMKTLAPGLCLHFLTCVLCMMFASIQPWLFLYFGEILQTMWNWATRLWVFLKKYIQYMSFISWLLLNQIVYCSVLLWCEWLCLSLNIAIPPKILFKDIETMYVQRHGNMSI